MAKPDPAAGLYPYQREVLARLEADHSPAPFRLVRSIGGFIITDAMGDSIGVLARSTGDHPAEEQLANAELFVASPKLLAALKGLVAVRPVNWDDEDEDPEQAAAWREADAAIALAEGGE